MLLNITREPLLNEGMCSSQYLSGLYISSKQVSQLVLVHKHAYAAVYACVTNTVVMHGEAMDGKQKSYL